MNLMPKENLNLLTNAESRPVRGAALHMFVVCSKFPGSIGVMEIASKIGVRGSPFCNVKRMGWSGKSGRHIMGEKEACG